VEQARTLCRDCRTQLWRLTDPLEELLDLVASQQLLPQMVDHLAVEGLAQRPLNVGARQRPFNGVLDQWSGKDPVERTFYRVALDRAHDRFLGHDLDRVVDPGRSGESLRGAGA
jgi:hypothetical protein